MSKTYQIIAKSYIDQFPAFSNPECNSNDPISDTHLSWMLHVISGEIKDPAQQSETKMHRWLGYVQGILVVKGMLNVNEERDRTRTIFNGE